MCVSAKGKRKQEKKKKKNKRSLAIIGILNWINGEKWFENKAYVFVLRIRGYEGKKKGY